MTALAIESLSHGFGARKALSDVSFSVCGEGLSVLWSTHMLDEVEPTDRLVVLHRGSVRWTGAAGELTASRTLEAAFLNLTEEAA
jgi:ABC-2 type transport system ATP-binding protein